MKRSEREAHKQAWEASETSKKGYCELNGIKYPTFISWFQEKASLPSFQKIEIKAQPQELEIVLPNGIRIYSRQRMDSKFLKLLQSV